MRHDRPAAVGEGSIPIKEIHHYKGMLIAAWPAGTDGSGGLLLASLRQPEPPQPCAYVGEVEEGPCPDGMDSSAELRPLAASADGAPRDTAHSHLGCSPEGAWATTCVFGSLG